MLGHQFRKFGLQYLAAVDERGKIFWLSIILQHVVVKRILLLIRRQNGGSQPVTVLGWSEGVESRQTGKGLHAILADKPVMAVLFAAEWQPRHNVNGGADRIIVRVAELLVSTDIIAIFQYPIIFLFRLRIVPAWTAGPVRSCRIVTRHQRGDDTAEYRQIIGPHLQTRHRSDIHAPRQEVVFFLIITTPQDKAGMVAQPLHLVRNFRAYILFEGIISRLPRIVKHKVLP